MSCGIDEILRNSQQTLEETMERFVQDLATDFDLDLDPATIRDSPQAKTLQGALETFTVWMIHERK